MSTEAEKIERDAEDGLVAEEAIPPPIDSQNEEKRPTSTESASSDTPSEKDGERPDGAPLKPTQSQADAMGKPQIVIIMLSLAMALFLAALDVTIITTALPTIAGHFKASSADYTWVGSSYLLANAASVPLWGKLSDIWGRKPVILMANIIFMVGSLIAAVSVSIGMLIGGRVIQGIGGGGLVILVNICIADLFSMRDRAKYYGIMGGVWAIASAIGPLLGGIFTEQVSWRWCFYINLPLDGTAFAMLVLFLKLDTPKTPFWDGIKAVDWVGVITIVGGVVMFLLGMESGGETHPWKSAYTLCLIIFGWVTIGIFFVNEWKFAKYPIMPLRLFNNRSNIATFGVCFCHGFVFIAGSYYLPLYFQTVLSATPILSGVYLFPLVISLSVFAAAVGIYIKRRGSYKEPIWFGLVFMTLGFGLFIDFDPYPNWAKIILYQGIAGMGVGPNFQSPLIALQSHVKGHDMATATATFGFVRQLSTSISVILGGVIFQNELAKKEGLLRQALGDRLARLLAGSSFGSTTALVRTLPPAEKAVLNQVYTSSLRTMWIFYTAVSTFAILVSLFITKRELSTQKVAVKTGVQEQERIRQEEKEEKAERRAVRKALQSPPGTANGTKVVDEV